MAVKITYTISDEDFNTIKKEYEKNKSKLKDITLEEFIQKMIDLALKSHLQLTNLNEQMLNIFSDITSKAFNPDELNKNNSNVDMSKIDDLINSFFNNKSNGSNANVKENNKKDKIKDLKDDKKKLN